MSRVSAQTKTLNPHGILPIGIECSDCHTTTSFNPLKDSLSFNHDSQTPFQLVGRHMLVSCQSCHVSNVFKEPHATNDACATCHADVHKGKLGADCQQCHNQTSFNLIEPILVHTRTTFPLTGAHVTVMCSSCHQNQKNGAFTQVDTDCYSCHKKDYERTANRALDHVQLGYPTECKQCHNTMGWANANFDHATVANYPLVGAHAQIRCQDCHVIPSMDLKFHPIGPNDCYSCHAQDYQNEHSGDNFPTTCLSCHNQNSWDGANFQHSVASGGFSLVGAHAKTDCASCHDLGSNTLKFNPNPSSQDDCISCHTADYQANHAVTQFPTDCKLCHSVNTFTGSSFKDHDSKNFPIYTGNHRNVWGTNCGTCHKNSSNYQEFSCTSCHEHRKDEMDSEHRGKSGYVYLSSACYNCNPRGTKK